MALTPSGRRLTDDLIAVHLANEERILAPLTAAQRDQLAELLGELAAVVEGVCHCAVSPRVPGLVR